MAEAFVAEINEGDPDHHPLRYLRAHPPRSVDPIPNPSGSGWRRGRECWNHCGRSHQGAHQAKPTNHGVLRRIPTKRSDGSLGIIRWKFIKRKRIHSMGSHVFLHLLMGSFTHIFVGLSLTLHFSRFWGPKVLVEPIKFDDLYVRWKSLSTICLGCCFTSKTPCFFNGWKAFHPKRFKRWDNVVSGRWIFFSDFQGIYEECVRNYKGWGPYYNPFFMALNMCNCGYNPFFSGLPPTMKTIFRAYTPYLVRL